MNWIAAALLTFPATCVAADISIGGTALHVPSPEGYGPVTNEMLPLYELQQHFVAPSNLEFVTFIPETDLANAKGGEIPDLPRRFSVQTARAIADRSIGESDFSKLKEIFKSQNGAIFDKVRSKVPGMLDEINRGIESEYAMDLAMSIADFMPLAAHEETSTSLAFSTMSRYTMNDADGSPHPFDVVGTTTLLHVRGKVLFLYAYGAEGDLEWTRSSSRNWALAVMRANPADPQSARTETTQLSSGGIDWGKVAGKAIAGGFIGLLFGLVSWMLNRRKSK